MKIRGKCWFALPDAARCVAAMVAVAILLLIAAAPAHGQAADTSSASVEYQADPSPAPEQSGAGGQTGSQPAPPTPTQAQPGRLAVNPITGVAVQSGANYVPLTGKERWKLYWKQNYLSFGAYVSPVFLSLAFDQATGSPKEWGGGMEGYGRRLASRTAGGIIQGTVQATVAPLLHEDVRYIASTETATGRRILHALVYSVVTYNGHGRPTPNLALIGADFASAGISTRWLPKQDSVARYTVISAGEQLAMGAAINLIQEFWSELTHKIARRP